MAGWPGYYELLLVHKETQPRLVKLQHITLVDIFRHWNFAIQTNKEGVLWPYNGNWKKATYLKAHLKLPCCMSIDLDYSLNPDSLT